MQRPVCPESPVYEGDYEEVIGSIAHPEPPEFSEEDLGGDYEELPEPIGEEEAIYDDSANPDQDYEEIPGHISGGCGAVPSPGEPEGRRIVMIETGIPVQPTA